MTAIQWVLYGIGCVALIENLVLWVIISDHVSWRERGWRQFTRIPVVVIFGIVLLGAPVRPYSPAETWILIALCSILLGWGIFLLIALRIFLRERAQIMTHAQPMIDEAMKRVSPFPSQPPSPTERDEGP